MGRLFILPDKEEVPGSNPGAPTSDLQGFLPLTPPPGSLLARFLQPKCVRSVGAGWDAKGAVGIVLRAGAYPPANLRRRVQHGRGAHN